MAFSKSNLHKVFFVFVVITVLSNCSVQSVCEKGERYLAEGEWKKAIPYLEECEKKRREEVVKVFGRPVTASETYLVVKGAQEGIDALEKWWESVLNLASAYLGEAGFDWLSFGKAIVRIGENAQKYQKGTEEEKEKALVESSRIAKEEIFGGFDKKTIEEKVRWAWKAQRLISEVLYGDPKFLDKFLEYEKDREKRKERRLPNVPELQGTPFEFKPETPQEWNIWRLGNNLEYLLAKTLLWKVASTSARLGYYDWVLQRQQKEEKTRPKQQDQQEEEIEKLPPLCCWFAKPSTEGGKLSWSSPAYPELPTSYDATDMIADVFGGARWTFLFSTGVSTAFANATTSFYDVIDNVIEGIANQVDRICQRFSDALTKAINLTVSTVFQTATTGTGIKVKSFAQSYISPPFIWACPRVPTRQIVEPQRFMCYPGNIKIPPVRVFYPKPETLPIIGGVFISGLETWLQDGRGCKEIPRRFAGRVTEHYPVPVFFFAENLTPAFVKTICENMKDVFAQTNKLFESFEECPKEGDKTIQQICNLLQKTNETIAKVEREINKVRSLPEMCF